MSPSGRYVLRTEGLRPAFFSEGILFPFTPESRNRNIISAVDGLGKIQPMEDVDCTGRANKPTWPLTEACSTGFAPFMNCTRWSYLFSEWEGEKRLIKRTNAACLSRFQLPWLRWSYQKEFQVQNILWTEFSLNLLSAQNWVHPSYYSCDPCVCKTGKPVLVFSWIFQHIIYKANDCRLWI